MVVMVMTVIVIVMMVIVMVMVILTIMTGTNLYGVHIGWSWCRSRGKRLF